MRWDDQTGNIVLDRFPVAADIGDDHRQTRRHALQHAVGETLLVRAQDADVGAGEQRRYVAPLAQPADMVAKAERGRDLRKPGAIAVVAPDT